MTYKISDAQIMKRVPKSNDNFYGSIIVDEIPIDIPAFVAFGGELTNTERGANSYASHLDALFEENDIKGINVYSVIYHFGDRDPKLERAEQFRIAGRKLNKEPIHPLLKYEQDLILNKMNEQEPVPNYVKKLFSILFLPRIADSNGLPLSVSDAISRIRKLKLYAHCHGAATIWQIANYMYKRMLEIGYSNQDIIKVQKEMIVIQHSPIAPLEKQKFSTISFASAEDTMMSNHKNLFADWFYENSFDIVPSYFGPKYGNIFVAGRLQAVPFKEHDYKGFLTADDTISPLTSDGEIIFKAERNALLRAANCAITGKAPKSVRALTDGDGVDFMQLKNNGEYIYKLMLNDLRQRNLKHGHQK